MSRAEDFGDQLQDEPREEGTLNMWISLYIEAEEEEEKEDEDNNHNEEGGKMDLLLFSG